MTDATNGTEITAEELFPEEAARLDKEKADREERMARTQRQNETLEEIGSIIENSAIMTLHHYGVIRETVVANDSLIIITTSAKVFILSPYERDMYTDELQRVAVKLASRFGHKLSDWGYTYTTHMNMAVCEYCGEPVVQIDRTMPKGAAVLQMACSASPEADD